VEAFAPMSVTLCLEDEIDISRGDMLAGDNPPHAGRRFEATVVWMNEKRLTPHRPYLLKHTTQVVQMRVRRIRHRVDVVTLQHEPAAGLGLNEIGVVEVEAHRPLFFDAYARNRATGGFIVIDPVTNETLGAGMIAAAGVTEQIAGRVTAAERSAARGHGARLILLPPGCEELAYALERHLFDRGWLVHVIERPEHLRQAVQTSSSAGMVSIVVQAAAEDMTIVGSASSVPVLRISTQEAGEDDAAARICRRIVDRDSPLTDGAGI